MLAAHGFNSGGWLSHQESACGRVLIPRGMGNGHSIHWRESDNIGQVCWGMAPLAYMLSINLWDAFTGGEGITKIGTKHFFVKLAGYQGRT